MYVVGFMMKLSVIRTMELRPVLNGKIFLKISSALCAV